MSDCCLLFFIRYPQPGRTKTRLISALGAEGAAQLQKEMAEYLLGKLRDSQWQVQVYFTGALLAQMQAWLGPNLVYCAQADGDLGCRLWRAFEQAFSAGAQRIVAVGADCPSLDARHIDQAFNQLESHNAVLGPANDGGYYLIGLRQESCQHQALFQGIDWSTPRVLQQTQAKARQLNLSLAELEMLSDVDRPQDLAVWRRIQAMS
ncbi:MAG: TIGR04282 family arsenosugar biosynthesis glycosyltransferase [Cyanobacteria bacterium P01_F01_bin.56]